MELDWWQVTDLSLHVPKLQQEVIKRPQEVDVAQQHDFLIKWKQKKRKRSTINAQQRLPEFTVMETSLFFLTTNYLPYFIW